MKGLYFLARPRPDLLQTALRFFQEALVTDPAFAKAHAGIANVFALVGQLNFAPPAEAWPKAKVAIEKALAPDPHLAEAHAVAASVAFWYDWDWIAAEASFNRLLSLNPGDALTHGTYAWFLLNRRRFEESLHEIKTAISLDPLMPLFYAWSVGLHAATGRCDDALADFARAVEIDPTFGLPYFHAGMAYVLKGSPDRAVDVLQQGSRIGVSPGWAEGLVALIRVAGGDREGAERIVGEMLAQKSDLNVSSTAIAWALGSLRDLDAAFLWFDRAVEERDSLMTLVHIYTEALVPAVARDPRYQQLLAKLNLADVVTGRPRAAV